MEKQEKVTEELLNSTEQKKPELIKSTDEIKSSAYFSLFAKRECGKVLFFQENPQIHGETTTTKTKLWSGKRIKKLLPEPVTTNLSKLKKETWGFGIRRLFFINQIEEQLSKGALQIVSLAAGLDPLLEEIKAKHPDITCYEMDGKNVLDFKKQQLGDKNIDINYVPGNVLTEFNNLFDEKILKGKQLRRDVKTIFLIEGLIPYLKDEDIIKLMTEINVEFTAEIWINVDSLTHNGIQNVYKKYEQANIAIETLKRNGEYIQTGYDKFQEQVAEKTGFVVTKNSTCADIISDEGLGNNPFAPLREHGVFTMHRQAKQLTADAANEPDSSIQMSKITP